ncbi:MAG TPA: PHB depolymerase family esterase [Candidatus Limnocylindrales bacterium]|nr:PHB depolymerase family esterase [Candidatus Limnocylindrales bacterium]
MRVAALLAVVCGLVACGGSGTVATAPASNRATPSQTQVGHVSIGGLARPYVVFQPSSLSARQKAPLLVAMHAYTTDVGWMESNTHFDDLAARAGFVVVYPQGIGNAWNAGRCCGHDANDDVTFIKDVVDQLVAQGRVDPKRVYATGMSNGGFMAQRLACEAPDRFAAVASVSGSLVTDSCSPSRAISVLEMHGLQDDVVPYNGGVVGGLAYFPPTASNMQQWATRQGCTAGPATTTDGITTTSTWTLCRDGATVMLDAIAGAGHSWFSPAEMQGEPDASQTVWNFFSHAPPLP